MGHWPCYLLLFVLGLKGCSHHSRHSLSLPIKSNEQLSLLFSHNINGETHPCGCRRFPLGGMAQVAGLMEHLRPQGPLIYVDAGDTFFSTSSLNPTTEKSSRFQAEQIGRFLHNLDLSFFVLGDQDLAGGMEFLGQLLQKNKITLLLANAAKSFPLAHRPWSKVSAGRWHLFLTAVAAPATFPQQYQTQLTAPQPALKKVISQMRQAGFIPHHPTHRLMILSHQGMLEDRQLAKKFPDISWIIGAHTQDFTKTPVQVRQTKIVQVLSRNHYLGQIIFSPKGLAEDQFLSHEIRDELKDHLAPNPYLKELQAFKQSIKKIQWEEELAFSSGQGQTTQAILAQTTQSCLQCHEEQTQKWQQTSHALAYSTLIRVNEESNTQCIGCHTLAYQKPEGFSSTRHLIRWEDAPKQLQQQQQKYWQAFQQEFAQMGEVRSLSAEQTAKYAQKWAQLDERLQVSHNFSNVQCLNCHEQSHHHPFEMAPRPSSNESAAKLALSKQKKLQVRCLSCHLPDQSPEWYDEDAKQQVNPRILAKKIKEVACPLL